MSDITAMAPARPLADIIADRARVNLACGHAPTEARHYYANGVPMTTGYATWPDGLKRCEACSNAAEHVDFAQADTYGGYLSSDGRSFTTWVGEPLARITFEGTARTGWHGSEVTYVRAIGPDGRAYYGKNGGRGMFLRLRLVKGQ